MAVVGILTKGRRFKWYLYMAMAAAFSVYCYYDGWINDKYKEDLSNLMFNKVLAVVLAVTFVVLVIGFFVIKKTRVVVDENGISVNGKLLIAWDSITELDDSREEKGLLDIFYTKDGKKAKYVLDNYKVDHFEEMLDEISLHRPDLLTPLEEAEVPQNQDDGEKE